MKNKFLSEFRFVYLYFLCAYLIDLIGIYSIERKLIISNPLIILLFLFFSSLILFLLNKQIGRILALLLLIFQGFINIVFKIVYIMQGQTVFSFSQLKFITEGTLVVTKFKIDYVLIINYLMIIILYFIIVYFYKVRKIRRVSYINYATRLLSIILISILSLSLLSYYSINTYFDYDIKAYSYPKTYKSYGVTGNAIIELLNYNNKPNVIDHKEVLDFLFSDKIENTGISENNNLIVLMVETFEWYSFLMDENLYPNGLKNLTKEDLNYLFPNIIKFYNNSLKMTNYFSKETTLYSENLALLGHHPYKTIPTYDHTFSDYSYSLPMMFKRKDKNYITNYYHNNNIEFYGRGSIMSNFGFDNVYGAERLIEEYKDELQYSEVKFSESFLHQITDSSMFEVAKEKMFPTNNKFFTYITTLTMHGSYEEYRDSLNYYYLKLDSINPNLFPKTKEGNYFKNYLASVLNFDEALGIMMDHLERNDILKNTTIVLFSDHNAYSNNLAYYIRNKSFYEPIVFNVPLMIYDDNIGNYPIDKFATNIDIVPTIFDIFGIDYYKNLYYGNSIFKSEESISYSYYYDSFLTDKILFNTLNKTIYVEENLNNEYIDGIEQKIKVLFEKIKYIDQWYYYYS